jgi:hypothetical protein
MNGFSNWSNLDLSALLIFVYLMGLMLGHAWGSLSAIAKGEAK